jgi:1,4-dihydroxy-2-naphthoate octaprenyltransferase
VIATYLALPLGLWLADGPAWGLLAFASLPLAGEPIRAVAERTDGPSLNAALGQTGRLLAAFSVLLTAGFLIALA